MASASSYHLRDRAAALRELAAWLRGLRALELVRLAGSDTWLGPSPEQCRTDLLTMRRDLQGRADDLTVDAYRLEQRADELDRAAASTGPR
jgi:hypothetical protein